MGLLPTRSLLTRLTRSFRFRLSRPSSLIILVIVLGFIYYSIPRASHEIHDEDESEDQEDSRVKITAASKSGYYEIHPDKLKRAEEKKRFKAELAKLPSEVTVGTKTFKLFEKKKVRFGEAKRFCRGLHNGRLGRASRLIETGEINKLDLLLKKAGMVSEDVWIGISRRKWRKLTKPPPKKKEEEDPHRYDMMMGGYGGGGGSREPPCPSLSTKQKMIHPTYCQRQMPFICEINSDPNWDKVGRRSRGSRYRSPPMRELGSDDKDDDEGDEDGEIVGDVSQSLRDEM